MIRVTLLLSVAFMMTSCEDKTELEPASEVSLERLPPNSMIKKHTGVYDGQIIRKLQSADPFLRLGMADFKLVISDSVAKGRKISDYLDQWISVKGDINGDEFIVSEWLD